MKKYVIIFLALCLWACKESKEEKEEDTAVAENETEMAAAADDGWVDLMAPENVSHWRGYNGEGLPSGWKVEDGILMSSGEGGDIGGDIIYDADKYEEFELTVDWKLSPEGNSGIFYHVVEDKKYHAPYEVAPEYQIIDQLGFPQKLEDWQSIGADYAMYTPDYKDEDLRPMGEWNTSKIVFTNDKATYYLNGKKTVEFVPYSEDWEKRRNSGKWEDYPDYGTSRTGYIGLQDHGSEIAFKNIKIKKL
ncbi:MAG: glycosyl hydrolase [Cytophagaceae bacterium]|nr:glycosyl hydrolase [Cytophagaceae bacterium]